MATAKKTAKPADTFDAMSINPEAFKEGYEKAAKSMGDFAEFNKGALEAFITSAGTMAKGAEKAAADHSSFAKSAYEDGVAAAKAAASSQSAQEAFDIQADYVRSAFEKNLSQFTKLADHWVSTSKEAAEPLTTHYGDLVEKIQSFRP